MQVIQPCKAPCPAHSVLLADILRTAIRLDAQSSFLQGGFARCNRLGAETVSLVEETQKHGHTAASTLTTGSSLVRIIAALP